MDVRRWWTDEASLTIAVSNPRGHRPFILKLAEIPR